MTTFDYTLRDAQATVVAPISPERFDIARYAAYEAQLLQRCQHFWEQDYGGVLVHRRVRAGEAFAEGAANMERSLALQLGALQHSMAFKADVPNFLEPWYGIGAAAAAFGFSYVWRPKQAPAVSGKFSSVEEALQYPVQPIADTPIGLRTLEMIRYFVDKTGGRLPISYSDVQSPLNVACNMVSINNILTDFYLAPEQVATLLSRVATLIADFTQVQQVIIGEALALPGHGFASTRVFTGFGMSDDSAIMISPVHYNAVAVPSLTKLGDAFGGAAFHSCGDWSSKAYDIAALPNLRMADGAFTAATDPSPNYPTGFGSAFANTGVVLNARMVGTAKQVAQQVRRLWAPGMKLIVVTYCETPEEQAEAYDAVHEICR